MADSNQPLVQKMVDYIGYSDAAMTKAAAVIKADEERAEKLAALVPEAVKACVEYERIESHQKEALAKALHDPVKAVELVIKLAGHRNAAELSRLGTPVAATKTAGHDPSNSLRSGYVGARAGGGVKASDIAFFRGLGLNSPTT